MPTLLTVGLVLAAIGLWMVAGKVAPTPNALRLRVAFFLLRAGHGAYLFPRLFSWRRRTVARYKLSIQSTELIELVRKDYELKAIAAHGARWRDIMEQSSEHDVIQSERRRINARAFAFWAKATPGQLLCMANSLNNEILGRRARDEVIFVLLVAEQVRILGDETALIGHFGRMQKALAHIAASLPPEPLDDPDPPPLADDAER